jgi:hypothetical protein
VARKRLARRSAIGLALLCELVVLNEQTRLPISSLRYGVVKFIARTDVHMLAACSLGTLTTLLLDVDGWDRQAQRSSSAAAGRPLVVVDFGEGRMDFLTSTPG